MSNPCYKAFVLAPIGIVKGTIVAAIVAPPVAVAVNVVTLINLPNDLYLLLKVVCTTVALGRNVKTLMMLLLAPIMCVVLTLVFVTPFLASFFGTLFVVAGTVFNNDIVTLEVVTKQKQFVVDYHKEHPENANRIAADVCNVPRAWSGRQFEIPLAKLFLGIVFIVYGTIVGGTLIPILNVLKVPFVYYRANKEFKNSLKNTDWWYFVFVLVGWVLMNAVLIPFVVLVLVPLYCLTIGPQCAYEALRVDVIGEGFREPLRLIRQFDLGLSVFCFDCEEKDVCSLVLEIEGRVAVSSSRSIHATEADVYCAFDEAACESVRGAVEAGWVAVGDLDAYEAHLMVGIPALAAHDVLAKEECFLPRAACSDDVTRVFWPKFENAKRAMIAAKMSDEEVVWVRRLLVTGDDPGAGVGQERETQLKRGVVSVLNGLAIDLSRLARIQGVYQRCVKDIARSDSSHVIVDVDQVADIARSDSSV